MEYSLLREMVVGLSFFASFMIFVISASLTLLFVLGLSPWALLTTAIAVLSWRWMSHVLF